MRDVLITRTVQTTKAICMVANAETESVEQMEFTIPRTYKTDEAVLKQVRKMYQTETLVPISVKATEVIEQRYGLPESEFIAIAKHLPPIKRKLKDEDTEQNYETEENYEDEE